MYVIFLITLGMLYIFCLFSKFLYNNILDFYYSLKKCLYVNKFYIILEKTMIMWVMVMLMMMLNHQ